ncbi:hypothetical protein ACU635_43905 [[Actinomadura] parvosata]|uniref:hypothetical protein n=1 Tax=[Actinomadura] parvosata TaxID=1955412 RepID=UPI00406C23DB
MTDPTNDHPIQPGNYVRSLVWPGHIGTVVSVFENGDLSVDWHGHLANDQINPGDVTKLTEEEKTAYIAEQPPGYDDGIMRLRPPEVEL